MCPFDRATRYTGVKIRTRGPESHTFATMPLENEKEQVMLSGGLPIRLLYIVVPVELKRRAVEQLIVE